MFLSKLFSIFRRKKKPEQQSSSIPGEAKTTIPTAGVAAGVTAGVTAGVAIWPDS